MAESDRYDAGEGRAVTELSNSADSDALCGHTIRWEAEGDLPPLVTRCHKRAGHAGIHTDFASWWFRTDWASSR